MLSPRTQFLLILRLMLWCIWPRYAIVPRNVKFQHKFPSEHLPKFRLGRYRRNSRLHPTSFLPDFPDYHGLFQIVKLPRLNSLTRFAPSTFDLAFKLRRKRFTVEKLHLPPDLAETAEREQDESARSKGKSKKASAAVFGGGCGGMTGGSSALDL